MQYSVMEQYWIWLSSVEGIGPRRFYQLLSEYEDARQVWDDVNDPKMEKLIGAKAYKNLKAARNEGAFYVLFEKLERLNIRVITRLSADYPYRLARTVDPPPALYTRGEADLNDERMFAMVGSRRCTRDGEKTAFDFAKELSDNGVTVVSGMALGIDANAHGGALAGSGKTVAVLGSGADVVYPMENWDIYEHILAGRGMIISEYVPGTRPLPGNFPARNRIISGLCDGVLIVEGAEKSGAMITVGCALEQGRDVFAVPGSIYARLSKSPNRLIVEGAHPAISPYDILEHYRWASREDKQEEEPVSVELSEDEQKIVCPLRKQALTATELMEETGFDIKKLNTLLTMLELRGIIFKQVGGEYRAF